MEPMVVCALGIVAYCGYLTVKDVVTDLTRKVLSSGSKSFGSPLKFASLRCFETLSLFSYITVRERSKKP